MSCLE